MNDSLSRCVAVLLFATLVMLVSATTAPAGIIIDDFTEKTSPFWPVSLTAGGAIGVTDFGLTTVVGGARTTFVTYSTGEIPGLDEVTADLFNGGGFSLLDYASSAGADGGLAVRYNGLAPGAMTLDLSGQGFIRIDLVSYDAPAGGTMDIGVLLISDWGGAGQQAVNLPYQVTTSGSQSVLIGLASVPSSVDFANINYIEVGFDAPKAADFRVDLIATEVPEPATMSLLAAGGLLLLRRRRQA